MDALKWVGGLVTKHFGGGVGYIYIAVAGVIAFQWGYISYLNARLDHVIVQRDNARGQSSAKGAVGNSLNRQAAKAEKNREDLQNVETEITNADDPLGFTYNWLRNKRKLEADNTDK